MSNAVFPSFSGLAWPVKRKPAFNTKVFSATSGRETRISTTAYPKYDIELSFEYLSRADWASLMAFFNLRAGKYDSFLFTDAQDNSITAQSIGTGNGSKTQFQLVRNLGGFTEPVENVNGTPSIYLDGVLQSSGYTISSTGLVTFSSAPGNGVAVTWTGNYYWRVRFDQDTSEFSENMKSFFDLKKLTFIGAVGNKV
jgi:uncharacterized protein (TIGR02217 family)